MRRSRSGITRLHSPRLLLAIALVGVAVPERGGGEPAPSPATEELIAEQAPTCPLDLEGSRRIEFRGKSWVVRLPEGERTYTEIKFPATPSPDGKRLAVGVKHDAWFLLVDGRETGPYEDISPPIFSPDGQRLAYFAKRDKRWFAVIDGEAQPSLVGKFVSSWIADKIAFSPDGRRVAYVSFTNNNKGHLIVDGQAWPECQDWRAHPVRFSLDSQHVAVACRLPGVLSETAVFLDGKEVARFNAVEKYEFRPGSSELAIFGVGRGMVDDLFVVGLGPTSGVEPGRKFTRVLAAGGPLGPYIGGPYFSRGGEHVAYSISDNRQLDLYVDGRSVLYRQGPALHSLALSADGTRLLALLSDRSRSWTVDMRLGAGAAGGWGVLESKETDVVSSESAVLSGAELYLSPSGQHWAIVAGHAALRAADNWQAVVLDGQLGPRYTSICLRLFPRWNADESLVYVASRAGSQYRVTQTSAATAP